MALSCLLRGSVSVCKVQPGLGIASRMSPISTFAYDKLTAVQKRNSSELLKKLSPPAQRVSLTDALRPFTTTSVKHSMGSDHGRMWSLEKYLSASMVVVAPLAVAFPNILFDLIFAIATTMHVHWGVEAVVVDYVRPIIFGKFIPKLSVMLVYVYSILLLFGLLNLTFRGKGIGNSVQHFWSI
ncbi:succinate dehydrogenase [ubiquinone] cytochrome b small subunit, mitochondrial [Cimex lectularius]|uniref:Succinate dehydrogenase [ubiquinone] cytochrome b small subunit n=1 Tax=Cimex lectularius TaxID=79782 RepID=A0A8I6SBN3_CIMLE|nr:succinate dehydrogenase [ubiquinone] cytochrome b small subunit, mitochondrial [Cimex lectularius]